LRQLSLDRLRLSTVNGLLAESKTLQSSWHIPARRTSAAMARLLRRRAQFETFEPLLFAPARHSATNLLAMTPATARVGTAPTDFAHTCFNLLY
jgi:hypothetical protein